MPPKVWKFLLIAVRSHVHWHLNFESWRPFFCHFSLQKTMLIHPLYSSTMLVPNNSNSNSNTDSPTMRRGAFVVLEGIDRSGKTSQCKLLLQRLVQAGMTASGMRFPNRITSTGKIINEYLTSGVELDDRAIHLLFSANRWEASQQLCQDLYQGTTVVCDRYAYSGVAFSSAKVSKKNKENEPAKPLLSLEWCQAPDKGLPAPDCVIFLQLSPEQAEERGG